MIFQCSDLERALRTPELMPEMRAHAAQCEACGRQLYVWTEISRLARALVMLGTVVTRSVAVTSADDATGSVDLIAVVQDAIHSRGWIKHPGSVGVEKVFLAARLDNRHIRVHDHIFGTGQFLDPCRTRIVIEMRMTDQQNFDVTKSKPYFLDALLNHGN